MKKYNNCGNVLKNVGECRQKNADNLNDKKYYDQCSCCGKRSLISYYDCGNNIDKCLNPLCCYFCSIPDI